MILGLNAYSNNAGAALYDGGIRFSAEEERFNRRKKSNDFPHGALHAAREAIDGGDVESAAFPWLPGELTLRWLRAMFGDLPGSLEMARPAASPHGDAYLPLKALAHLRRDLRRHLGRVPRIHYVGHHEAHAASALFTSPFDEALVLVTDAFGDKASTSAYLGRGNRLTEVYSNSLLHSLGILYSSVTLHLGYRTVHDEGKVMALASYGTEELVSEFKRIVRLLPDGTADFDFSYLNYHRCGEIRPLSRKFVERFGPARRPGEPLTQRHKDIAAALQRTLEDALLHIVRALRDRHGARNLALAGGVALNCVAAGRIAREAELDAVHVPACPDDGGTPLGAAMYVHHCIQGHERTEPSPHAFHGPGYGGAAIDRALGGRPSVRVADPAGEAAALIADGQVVAWFQGRMEMGPRALGGRSILADPRRAGMPDHLNANVKHREGYRPYAPSVLDEEARACFPDTPDSPFMSFAATVAGEWQATAPGIVHVDGTARLQTVRRDVAPLYHRLISAFRERTGVPMVLNTSFNDQEPICCTPEDAVRCFEGTAIDSLVIGDRVVRKEPRPHPPAAEPVAVTA